MSAFHGKFVWYELMAKNTKAAEEFYKHVIGWESRDAGHDGMDYTIFTAGGSGVGGSGVGGVWQLTDEACAHGAKPGWYGYIQVDDIAASAAQVTAEGGHIAVPPEEIPGVGQFSVAIDPQGAKFILFQQPNPQQPAPQHAPGQVGWHELYVPEYAPALDFYIKLFGWTKTDAMDMGPAGTYQMFATGGPHTIGGTLNKPAEKPTGWLFYVNVPTIDAAVERIQSSGGSVIQGPIQVPGGSWIVQAHDPEGILFALVAPQR